MHLPAFYFGFLIGALIALIAVCCYLEIPFILTTKY